MYVVGLQRTEPLSKTTFESLRKRQASKAAHWYDPDVRAVVERAAQQAERNDKLLWECLPGLTHFERELVKAAFAAGRRSYADDCEEDVEIMRELGLAA